MKKYMPISTYGLARIQLEFALNLHWLTSELHSLDDLTNTTHDRILTHRL